jgi:tetratricopeptide (TPR) repeat protein
MGLARKKTRSSQDARALLLEVVEWTNGLSAARPEWMAPRILRGEARTFLGQMEDAWADLVVPAGGPKPDLSALLAASFLWHSLAERERKAGSDGSEQAQRALEFAGRALAMTPEHPLALTLHSMSSLLLAQTGIGRGQAVTERLDGIIRAQERALAFCPDFVRARMVLASAHFLRGEAARDASGQERSPEYERAERELNVILGRVRNHAPARYLRGLIRFISSDWESAALDWTELLEQYPDLDTPELREWLRRARDGESR